MPTGTRRDPVASYHFYVDVESVFQGTFREVSGMGSENPVIEYWSAGKGGETKFTKIPGRVKYNDITMKSGTTDDTLKLTKWREQVEQGKVNDARQNGTIWMFAQDNSPVASWRFYDAWPIKLVGPAANSNANEPAIEELTIAVEKLERNM
jgi:phage tail-like protein